MSVHRDFMNRSGKSMSIVYQLCTYLVISLFFSSAVLADGNEELQQLKSMSLENLMKITVFSASKKSEQLSDVAAAMYVITREDIRRSGARTLPDLLRGVPGLTVANMDSHTWAVSSRGFTGLFSNKLLVLMDGRTLYTPLYSGVYWDMQDTLLEDIERIEIIRGPGATIWGANAVNGVINIITRKAEDTGGVFLSAGGGSLDKSLLNARFGKAGEQLSYRVYAKNLNRDNFEAHEGTGGHPDDWQTRKAGFRIDWTTSSTGQLTFQGDIYTGKSDQLMTLGSDTNFQTDVDYSGGNLQLQLQKQLNGGSELNIQAYMDRTLRDDGFLDQSQTIWDLSFNHHFSFLGNQEIIWGGGYRYITDQTSGNLENTWDPASDSNTIFNMFLQDDFSMLDHKLHLLLGSKFEHNDYTGCEIQPTARIIWTPDTQNSFWAAISRAVRTPSRTDRDLTSTGIMTTATTITIDTPGGPVTVPALTSVNVYGDKNFAAEELLAYELGYRSQLNTDVSLDIALFYNDYKELRTQEPGTPVIDSTAIPVEIIVPVSLGNNMSGESFGAEVVANWQASDIWRLRGSYSWINIQLHHHGTSGDLIGETDENTTPEHQASLNSYVDLPHNLEWDTTLFYFSRFYINPEYPVPAHLRCDMRLGWNPTPVWELSVKVENLFDDQHQEFFDNLGLITSEVPRNWYAEIKYRF